MLHTAYSIFILSMYTMKKGCLLPIILLQLSQEIGHVHTTSAAQFLITLSAVEIMEISTLEIALKY